MQCHAWTLDLTLCSDICRLIVSVSPPTGSSFPSVFSVRPRKMVIFLTSLLYFSICNTVVSNVTLRVSRRFHTSSYRVRTDVKSSSRGDWGVSLGCWAVMLMMTFPKPTRRSIWALYCTASFCNACNVKSQKRHHNQEPVNFSFAGYLQKYITQIYRALYGDAMFVPFGGTQTWRP